MRRCIVGALALALALALGAIGSAVSAQTTLGLRAGVAASAPHDSSVNALAAAGLRSPALRVTPRMASYAPMASAIVPGAGQFMLGNSRAVAYGAIEVLSWVMYFQDQHDQVKQERAFKDIARRVARAHFSANPPDGGWSYYELMREHLESGVYSKSDSSVVPETDVSTYNGFEWEVLRRAHPDSLEAIAIYEQVAIHPDFLWSWRNAGLQWDLFIRTTALRNDAFRRSQRDLAVVLANHVLSMVDAFTTVRLRVQPTANGGTGIGASFRW